MRVVARASEARAADIPECIAAVLRDFEQELRVETVVVSGADIALDREFYEDKVLQVVDDYRRLSVANHRIARAVREILAPVVALEAANAAVVREGVELLAVVCDSSRPPLRFDAAFLVSARPLVPSAVERVVHPCFAEAVELQDEKVVVSDGVAEAVGVSLRS